MIEPGNFLSTTYVHTQPNGQTVSELVHYLVLDVSDRAIDVIPLKGSPYINAAIFDWSEIAKDYQIVVISSHTEESIRREFISRYSNLKCQEEVATVYTYDGKSVTLPCSKWYFSGNGVWKERE